MKRTTHTSPSEVNIVFGGSMAADDFFDVLEELRIVEASGLWMTFTRTGPFTIRVAKPTQKFLQWLASPYTQALYAITNLEDSDHKSIYA
jgi:hypothetical protein